MAHVQIRCPNSGLWAWTSVEVDPATWESAQYADLELVCGICGERHVAAARGLRVPPWSQASLTPS